MKQEHTFSEFAGTPDEVRDARRSARGAFARVIDDVREVPHLAGSGLRADWNSQKTRLSPAALIRRYPLPAVGAAIAAGFLAMGLAERPRQGSSQSAYINIPSARSAGEKIRRLLRTTVATDDRLTQARNIGLSLAGQFLTAAFTRILAEHTTPKTRASGSEHNNGRSAPYSGS